MGENKTGWAVGLRNVREEPGHLFRCHLLALSLPITGSSCRIWNILSVFQFILIPPGHAWPSPQGEKTRIEISCCYQPYWNKLWISLFNSSNEFSIKSWKIYDLKIYRGIPYHIPCFAEFVKALQLNWYTKYKGVDTANGKKKRRIQHLCSTYCRVSSLGLDKTFKNIRLTYEKKIC